jgi:hypothetical protein
MYEFILKQLTQFIFYFHSLTICKGFYFEVKLKITEYYHAQHRFAMPLIIFNSENKSCP